MTGNGNGSTPTEQEEIMQHTIKPKHVMGVILEVDKMLKQGNFPFNTLEVMLGLQELVGRIIVDMAATAPGAQELIEHSKKHLDSTVQIGMQQKNQSVIVPS